MKQFIVYVIGLLFFLNSTFIVAQSQKELEAKKKSLYRKIESLNALRETNQAKGKDLLESLNYLDTKITAQSELVLITNQQIKNISSKIKKNINEIAVLNQELKKTKEDYVQMLQKSYKMQSKQNRLLFLFSSHDFWQAYKRLIYFKQYTRMRKRQGEKIQRDKVILDQKNKELAKQKKKQLQLQKQNQEIKNKLLLEQKQQQEWVAQIQKNTAQYIVQIQESQKQAQRIEQQIRKLIRAAIAKTNKNNANYFKLTPEGVKLAKTFEYNKGKLPWPVLQGVVVKGFGKQRHPVLKNIYINNSGIDIETPDEQQLRAVFSGEVSSIQAIKGAGKLLQIRHGNYISTYYNVKNISVKVGDKVTAKQPIGKVSRSKITNRSILKFSVFQKGKFLDPTKWLIKM